MNDINRPRSYKLLYMDDVVASVEEDEMDFLSCFGRCRIEVDDSLGLARVREYIDYSLRVSPLIEENRFDDPAFLEEENFMDLIDSNDWCLVDNTTGKKHPILVPIFHTNGGLVWRWNARKKVTDPGS